MSQLVTGRTGDWEIVIGLEFMRRFQAKPNYFPWLASFVRRLMKMYHWLMGMPGMLPVINRECVYQPYAQDLDSKHKLI